MKMRNMQDINAFRKIISNAAGYIWAEDEQGKEYDLKNEFVQYMVIGEMLKETGAEMQIYASNMNDECRLIQFLMQLGHGAA